MLKAPFKLLLLLVWIVPFIPPIWLALKLKKWNARDRLVRWCYAGILRIIGIRLQVNGPIETRRPLLLVTNHVSYLDVAILGSQAPVHFTPKSEIAGWPVIGLICRLCGCIFIDRRPEKLNDMKQAVRDVLTKNSIVCLFPESTTGNGIHLLPFKSAFFSLAEEGVEGRELIVQPAAISYTHIRRLPIDRNQWPSIAWYGDMTLVPHLMGLLKLGPITAELTFLPSVTISQCADRKNMADYCQQAIARAIADTKERRPAAPNGIKKSFLKRLLKVK